MKKTFTCLTAMAVVGTALLVSIVGPPNVSHAQLANLLRYVAEFEDGTTGNFVRSGNMPVASQAQRRSGSWSMRAYLDRRNSPVPSRTEIEVPGNQRIGEVHWVGLSVYLPETHVRSDLWEIVFQMHDRPNDWNNVPQGRNPPFAIDSSQGIGGAWRILGKYNSTYNGGGGTQKIAFDSSVGKMHAGWNDFVFNWRWAHSHGQGGFSRVWIDGQMVIDYSGPNTFNDQLGPYTKFGIYKGWNDRYSPGDRVQTRDVYFDEFREAGAQGSYELVAPRGGVSRAKPKPPVLSVQ